MNFRSETASKPVPKGSVPVELKQTRKDKMELHLDEFDNKDLVSIVRLLENAGVDMNRFRVTKYDKDTNTITLTRITTVTYDKGSLLREATYKNGKWGQTPYHWDDASLKCRM